MSCIWGWIQIPTDITNGIILKSQIKICKMLNSIFVISLNRDPCIKKGWGHIFSQNWNFRNKMSLGVKMETIFNTEFENPTLRQFYNR